MRELPLFFFLPAPDQCTPYNILTDYCCQGNPGPGMHHRCYDMHQLHYIADIYIHGYGMISVVLTGFSLRSMLYSIDCDVIVMISNESRARGITVLGIVALVLIDPLL
jgi:hypothetical protein